MATLPAEAVELTWITLSDEALRIAVAGTKRDFDICSHISARPKYAKDVSAEHHTFTWAMK